MTSPHFIQQYFTSFCEDPVLKSLEKVRLSSQAFVVFNCWVIFGVWSTDMLLKETEGDADEQEGKQGYLAARQCLRCHKSLVLCRAIRNIARSFTHCSFLHCPWISFTNHLKNVM